MINYNVIANIVEKYELSSGEFLTNSDIASIISYIASYDIDSNTPGIQIAQNVNDVKSCSALMTYISSQWHT